MRKVTTLFSISRLSVSDLIQVPVRLELLKTLLKRQAGMRILQFTNLYGSLQVPVDEVERGETSIECYLEKN